MGADSITAKTSISLYLKQTERRKKVKDDLEAEFLANMSIRLWVLVASKLVVEIRDTPVPAELESRKDLRANKV